MCWNLRLAHIAVIPLFALAIGCSSTSGPEPEPEVAAPSVPAKSDVRSGASIEDVALEPVYFVTDEASLMPDARETLARTARSILKHPEWGVLTIEGHCDERGGYAYNQALGARRARAVERFLIEQGVPAERLATRSFGSTQPAVDGHDESAWRYNRRSELELGSVQTALR